MTRVKKGVNAIKTRRNVLKRAKGYRYGRSTKERQAYEALAHAGSHAFAHRRDKKNDFRKLWNIKIGATLKQNGTSYSKFIDLLKKKEVALDRKVLAQIAEKNPETFQRIIQKVS